MQSIQEPTDNFDFNNLILNTPYVVNGEPFIKYRFNDTPLYIQPPKCRIKKGIQSVNKSNKKLYCDLTFTNEDSSFIKWLENLENYTTKIMYNNREKWFETDLEQNDIEESFISPLKISKSEYIIRVYIPTILGKSSLKIYDEDENLVDIEKIKENENVITILEIQGIKCSPTSFKIDIEMKQLLVLKPVNIFEKCIFKINKNIEVKKEESILEEKKEIVLENIENSTEKNTVLEDFPEEQNNQNTTENNTEELEVSTNEKQNESSKNKDGLEEIDIVLDVLPPEETFSLKNRNEVYYTMYKDAVKKAKMAKEIALASYLEAKRIKNTYMLNDIDEESDLEDLDKDLDI
jgi:hypothetical protein